MTQLPRKVGHFTLMRRLGADAVSESYVAILDEPAGKQVVARRIHPAIVDDPVIMSRVRARVRDLEPLRHPAVARVRGIEELEGDVYVLEDWVEGVGLDRLIERAREHHLEAGTAIPHNVFLDLATQVCNGLEAMHGRPGQESGADNVLHMGMSPQAVVVRENGQLVLCAHGLVASPTILPQSASALTHARMEYLSPEQTHPEQPLGPATDVFALGSVLYELLTLKPLFRAASNLQTVHRVRKAEVTTELLEVKDLLPGLDRVLYRALSVNPRHRYQRAFVLREDLRGLMAGYSFADIASDARAALAPFFAPEGYDEVQMSPAPAPRHQDVETTAALLGDGQPSLFDATTLPPGEVDHDAETSPDMPVVPRGTEDVDHDAATMPPGTATPEIDHDADTWTTKRSEVDHDADTQQRAVAEVDHDAATVSPGPGQVVASSEDDEFGADDLTNTAPLEAPTEEANRLDGSHLPDPPPLTDDSDTASFLRTVQKMGTTPDPVDPVEPADTMAFIKAASQGRPAPEPELSGPHAAPIAAMAPHTDALDAPELSVLDTQERPSPFGDDAPPSAVETQEAPAPLPVAPPEKAPAATPEPDALSDAEAAAAARQRLAPSDSLHPPPSVPPAVPRHEQPTIPSQRPPEPEESDEPIAANDGVPWVPVAIVGAVALVAVIACLGMGGTGALFGASQMASTDRPVPAPTTAAPTPTPTPQPSTAAAESPKPQALAVAPTPQAPAPEPVPSVATVPDPAPIRPTAAPEPSVASVAPRPAPTARTRPTPAPLPPPPAPEPPATTYDAVAAADDVTRREQGTSEAEPAGPVDRSRLETLAGPAFSGALTAADRTALQEVTAESPVYTRAHTLLYLDAKARGDAAQRDRYLGELMALPENQYNPALLVEEAWVAMGRRDWATALSRSDRAERHWARLPSELIFSRKAMIYEIQAKAHLGSFYASEGDDAHELDHAIKGWQKYKRHAETQARSDLMATADQQLARLHDIQQRLE